MNEADLPIWVQFACAALAGAALSENRTEIDALNAADTADAMMKEFIKRREGIE